MKRSSHGGGTAVRPRRRNFAALVVAAAATAALSMHYQPVPAGADPDALGLDLGRITQDVNLPEAAASGSPATARPARAVADEPAGNVLAGRSAMLFNALLLEEGIKRFSRVPGYTATFYRRERVGGALGDEQVMQMKLRHEPFSLYLKWLVGDKGRELLYVDGENDGKMLVKVGGVKGRLLPPIKLDLDGAIARRESRHSITDLGLLRLAELVLERRRRELQQERGTRCRMFDEQTANDRLCYGFLIEYADPAVSPVYRKSVVFVDQEWLVPIYIKNFTWPEGGTPADPQQLDEATMIEHYSYSNIRLDVQLADGDFDRNNEKYQFRR